MSVQKKGISDAIPEVELRGAEGGQGEGVRQGALGSVAAVRKHSRPIGDGHG